MKWCRTNNIVIKYSFTTISFIFNYKINQLPDPYFHTSQSYRDFLPNKAVKRIGVISLVVALGVLFGWAFNIQNFESVIPGMVNMKMNTAICFALLGWALILKNQQQNKPTGLVYTTLLLAVSLTGGVTLLEYQLHFDAHIDQIIVADHHSVTIRFPFPGRMAYNTAASFTLLGLGLLGLNTKAQKFHIVFQYLLHIVTVISGVAIMGYVYGVSMLYNLSYVSSMAIHTAILLFLLSIAASLLNPRLGVTKLFKGTGIGNQMARRHFTTLMLVLIVFGSLRIQSERFHILPPEIGISLLAISLLLTSLIMIWLTANWLNKVDAQRSKAEEEIKNINTNLELKVEERSAKLKELYTELQKSEERYRSLFEHASDAIYVLSNTGDFMDVNESVCVMTGYSREELLRMNITSLMNAELLQNYPLVYTGVKPGSSVIAERKIIMKNGNVLDVEINLKRFVDERILVIARDITQRKLMEAELRMAEVRFRTLAEKSMVGIYIVQNRKVVYVNRRFAEIFNYEPDELIGSSLIDTVIHPDYRDVVNEMVRLRNEESIESMHYETMGKRKDGSSNWVEFYGTRTFFEDEPTFIGSMIDITDRKKIEDEIKISEQKYKLLFESNPMPLWIVAKDDMTVIAANNAAARLYGYTSEELLHMDIKKLRPAAYWDKLSEKYRADIMEATDFGVIEHLKKDGTSIFVNIIAQDIMFEGRFARLSSTSDVTEKLKAQELLKKSEANLQTILNNTDTAYALLNADLDILEYNNKALIFAKNEFNFEPGSTARIYDLMPEDRRLQFLEYTDSVFKGDAISYEVSYPQEDNNQLWYYVRLFPIADKGNKILGLVLAITDITERKEAEQDLQTAYQSIQLHIEKIREMAWKQSHLIRSPLANLKGLFPMLKADPADGQVLGFIETELERMDEILWEMAEGTSTIGIDKAIDRDNR